MKRVGHTDVHWRQTIMDPAFDLHSGQEIAINVTDNRGQKSKKSVPISQLRRAAPTSKDTLVLILKEGASFGRVGNVTQVKKKEKKAKVQIPEMGLTEDYLFSDLCKISMQIP